MLLGKGPSLHSGPTIALCLTLARHLHSLNLCIFSYKNGILFQLWFCNLKLELQQQSLCHESLSTTHCCQIHLDKWLLWFGFIPQLQHLQIISSLTPTCLSSCGHSDLSTCDTASPFLVSGVLLTPFPKSLLPSSPNHTPFSKPCQNPHRPMKTSWVLTAHSNLISLRNSTN